MTKSKGYAQLHEDSDISQARPHITSARSSRGGFSINSGREEEQRTAMEDEGVLKPDWKRDVTIGMKEDWRLPEYSDSGIELQQSSIDGSPRGLSSLLKRSRRLTNWSQLDSLVLIAGIVAILLGSVALADAYTSFRIEAFEASQRQNVSTWAGPSDNPAFYPVIALLHQLPSWMPLVLFGIGTAIAWTCTQRAVYRIALLESRRFLRRGVHPQDLSNMLELKRPSRSWLKWRMRMWKTTSFAMLCILVYASTALMYRLAFSFRNKSYIYNLDDIGREVNLQSFITTLPLFGCTFDPSNPSPTESDLGKPANETRMQLNVFSDFVTLPEAFAQTQYDLNITTSDDAWEVLFGIHGLYRLARYIELQTPQENFMSSMAPKVSSALEWDFQGPFVSAVWTHDSNATVPDVIPFVGTKTHPTCGDLLYVCMSSAQGDCYYMGIYPGNFTSRTGAIETNDPANDVIPVFDSALIITGPNSISMSGNCPTRLDTGLYTKIAQEYTGYWSACNNTPAAEDAGNGYITTGLAGDNHNWLSDCAEGPLRTAFAMILAFLANNPSLILDPQPMEDLGLLSANMSIDDCQKTLAWQYDGTIVAYWQVSTWPGYETAAAVCLIVWGGLLVFASWPFKKLIFRGTVEHWLATGADVGSQHRSEGGIGESRWRLRTSIGKGGIASFWMEKVADGRP